MKVRLLVGLVSPFLASVACTRPDPITDYAFITQWMGDKSYEQGTTVCGIARARQHLIALPQESLLTCRPQDYVGSSEVVAAFSDPPAWIEELPWDHERPAPRGPITKTRAFDAWSVGLAPSFGLVVDTFVADMAMERRFQVQLASTQPLADLEVAGPVAVVADGVDGLAVVRLDALPEAEAVARLSLGAPTTDVYVDGDRAVALAGGALVVVDLADPGAPVARGRLPFGAPVQGVGLRANAAWIASQGSLYAVDLADPDSPRLVDEAGVESTVAGITLIHEDYLFQAPGFDAPLAVTHLGDPLSPEPFWAFMGGNGVFDVAAMGHTLYLAVGSGGVHLWGPKRDYADAFGQ